MARAGALGSPFGAGTVATILSSNSPTPMPVFPETRRQSAGSPPIRLASSSAYFSGCAAGRSILFRTGIIVSSFSIARYKLASVWASIP